MKITNKPTSKPNDNSMAKAILEAQKYRILADASENEASYIRYGSQNQFDKEQITRLRDLAANLQGAINQL